MEPPMSIRKIRKGALVAVLVLVGVGAAFIYSSTQGPALDSLSDAHLKSAVIRLERTLCDGNCPAYTVTIHGNGRVEYDGKRNVKVTGAQEGKIEPAAVRALLSKFADAKFMTLAEDSCDAKSKCRVCTDMQMAIPEVTVGSATHRVKHYYGCLCAPKVLFELEAAIDKAANVEQWTGDVSKQGPDGSTCGG